MIEELLAALPLAIAAGMLLWCILKVGSRKGKIK
jgi:hypothetical protein